jgi:hypothetical protein
MNNKTSSVRRIALSVLTAGALTAGIAGTASAATAELKTGYAKISYDGLAVGKNIDAKTGIAAGKAKFVWTLRNGVTQVNVTGDFSAVGRSGVPVRLDLNYYTGHKSHGTLVSSNNTLSATPASDAQLLQALDWTPTGDINVLSAKLCVASDADRDGNYTDEKCIITSL